MKQTYGNSFRHNDLHNANCASILCFCEESTVSYCEQLSNAFSGKIPFGFMGVAPWFGAITNEFPIPYLDSYNLEITKLFLKQTEVAMVIYFIDNKVEYIDFCKKMLPQATHILFDSSKDNIDDLIATCTTFAKDYPIALVDPNREPAEWLNVSFSSQEKEKKVLLVGDSISRGYSPFVAELLPDYTVDSLNTSEGTGHQNIYDELQIPLSYRNYDVIHFNNGIHLHNISFEEYEKNIRSILQFLRNTAPTSSIVFTNTTTTNKKDATPSNYNAQNFQLGGQTPSMQTNEPTYKEYDPVASATYVRLNEIAAKVCSELNIVVNDLFHVCLKENLEKRDFVHLTPEGYKVLAEKIVEITLSL